MPARTMLAIQFIATQALRDAGEHDADWLMHDEQCGVDYSDYASVEARIGWLELDEPGRYTYRIVELASDEDSYLELQAENLDALEALGAWVNAGCPRQGNELQALGRAGVRRAEAVPVKVVSGKEKAA